MKNQAEKTVAAPALNNLKEVRGDCDVIFNLKAYPINLMPLFFDNFL